MPLFACKLTVTNRKKLATENQGLDTSPDDFWLFRVWKQEPIDQELGQHGLIDAHLDRVSEEWIRVEIACSSMNQKVASSVGGLDRMDEICTNRAGEGLCLSL
jgi:hypothetical protein